MWNVQSLNQNKCDVLLDYLLEKDIHMASLSETWFLDENNYQTGKLANGGDYFICNRPRVTDTIGGGVCTLMKKRFRPVRLKKQFNSSFESVSLLSSISGMPSQKLKIVTIYRRERVKFSVFVTEFSSFVQNLTLSKYPFIIGGDFNIQMNHPEHSYTRRFTNLCKEQNLSLNNVPKTKTHKDGNTIEFIVCDAKADSLVVECFVDYDAPIISHHYPIIYSLKTVFDIRPLATSVPKRNYRTFDKEAFKHDLTVNLSGMQDCTTFESKVELFQSRLHKCYDKHVPLYESKIHHNERPFWMDHEYVVQRALRRKLERTYKRTKSIHDEINFKLQRTKCSLLVGEKIDNHCSKIIESSNSNSKSIFNLYEKMVGGSSKTGSTILPDIESYGSSLGLANAFNSFFVNKVEKTQNYIHSQLQLEQLNHVDEHLSVDMPHVEFLSEFKLCESVELKEIILKGIKTTYGIDPLPKHLMSDSLDELLPHLLDLVNTSLRTGSIDGVKFSHVRPLLKKFDMDFAELLSYRAISNLSFISKLIERVVAKRLDEHMTRNQLHNNSQHGYKANHSSETLLMKFLNDILVAVDKNRGVVVLLIDLSSAFDTVHHSTLLKILKKSLYIKGTALDWFQSFLSGRSQAVVIDGVLSDWVIVSCGVPQGSVLGPILFNIYCRHINQVFMDCGFISSSYADDNSALRSFALFNQFNVLYNDVPNCLKRLKEYMLVNHLKLNDSKTEVIVFGSPKFKQQVTLHGTFLRSGHCIRFAETVKHLGVLFDSLLTFDSQIQKVISSSYSSLRKISSFRNCLSKSNLESLIHAFISSKLDYCNILYVNLPKKQMNKLQKLQNSAIRLVFGVRSRHPVSELFSELHWLKVEQRVMFKCLLLVFKCINGLAPNDLNNMIAVRNTENSTLYNTFYNFSKYGKRAFEYYASRYWNILPVNIRRINNVTSFKTALKSYLIVNYVEFKQKISDMNY